MRHTVTKIDMETAVPCGYEDVGAMPLCYVKKLDVCEMKSTGFSA
jgi:hypothetical protein